MVDRAERGERLAHGRLVSDIEGDALRVDVGALGIAAEDHDVPAGVDREPRRCQADAGRASDESRSHAAIIANVVRRSPRSAEQRDHRRHAPVVVLGVGKMATRSSTCRPAEPLRATLHRLSPATLHTIERWVSSSDDARCDPLRRANADRPLRRRPRRGAARRPRGARDRRGGRPRRRSHRRRSRTSGSAARTRRARTTGTSPASPRSWPAFPTPSPASPSTASAPRALRRSSVPVRPSSPATATSSSRAGSSR